VTDRKAQPCDFAAFLPWPGRHQTRPTSLMAATRIPNCRRATRLIPGMITGVPIRVACGPWIADARDRLRVCDGTGRDAGDPSVGTDGPLPGRQALALAGPAGPLPIPKTSWTPPSATPTPANRWRHAWRRRRWVRAERKARADTAKPNVDAVGPTSTPPSQSRRRQSPTSAPL